MKRGDEQLLANLFILYCCAELTQFAITQILDLMPLKKEAKMHINRLRKSTQKGQMMVFKSMPVSVREEFKDSCYDSIETGIKVLSDSIMAPVSKREELMNNFHKMVKKAIKEVADEDV